MSLVAELKRRNVFNVDITYSVVTWAIKQVVVMSFSPFIYLSETFPRSFFEISNPYRHNPIGSARTITRGKCSCVTSL